MCNHQRAVPKTHDKSMANLEEKLEKKKEQIKVAENYIAEANKKGESQAEKVNISLHLRQHNHVNSTR